MISIEDLPQEIMLYIFRIYLETENQRNLLKVISKVCSSWKILCFDPSLWKTYDGTIMHKNMMTLCKKGCLSNTKKLIFSSTKTILQDELRILLSTIVNLRMIDFSKIKNLTSDILVFISENCPHLHDVTFSKSDSNRSFRTLDYDKLGPFFINAGKYMLKINLSGCNILNFTQIIRCIADCCTNLQELHLSVIDGNQCFFPTDYVQKKCTKLRILHLNYCIRLSENFHVEGFPDLEVFTLPHYNGCDKRFSGIVCNSVNLKFLNLTYSSISVKTLCSIPASSLEYLYITKSKVCESKNLGNLFQKWKHSLKEIDVANSPIRNINEVLITLIDYPVLSQIEYLNLTGTKVSADVIQMLLENCTKLQTIHLESCRNLGRGMKMAYHGKSSLQTLSNKLQIFMANRTVHID